MIFKNIPIPSWPSWFFHDLLLTNNEAGELVDSDCTGNKIRFPWQTFSRLHIIDSVYVVWKNSYMTKMIIYILSLSELETILPQKAG